MANPYRAAVPSDVVKASEDRFLQQDVSAADEKERMETEIALANKSVPSGERSVQAQIDCFRAQIDAAIARKLLTPEQAAIREEQYYRGMLSALGSGRGDEEDRKVLMSLVKEAMKRD